MIKEEEKKKKDEKSLNQILKEYARTVGISFCAALIFTIFLSINAREQMIKNLYISAEERQKIEEKIAKQIISQSNLTETLNTKNYTICILLLFIISSSVVFNFFAILSKVSFSSTI